MNFGTENEYQEFKESLDQLDKGLKSITAMLNKHREATVYFGVNDRGDICGLTIGENTLMNIRSKVKETIAPRIYPNIEICEENEKTYIKITAKGNDIPYSYDGRYYIRTISADEQADHTILRKMLASSEADLAKEKESPKQNLKFDAFFTLLNANGIHPQMSDDFLGNYGLLNNNGKLNMNAYLLADNNNLRINIVTFAGKDKSVITQRSEYGNKCLLISINEVISFFNSINTTDVDLNEVQRKEYPLFDKASFREAWINACLHNNWLNEIPPMICLFDDRIEIISYGGLPYNLSTENFFKGVSLPVNKSLATIFIATNFAEHNVHGVPKIVSKYGKEAFEFNGSTIKVTIPFDHEPNYVTIRKSIERKGKKLTANQEKVYNAMKENSSISLKEIAEQCNLSLGGVKKISLLLQKYGYIERKDSKKAGHWIVK